MFTDTQIECSDCNNPFTFSVRDQEFYESKGYAPPKRCRDCRETRKQNKGQGGGQNHDRGGDRGGNRAPRELFPAVCADCGKDTEVPFKPSGGRPVYCRDCFKRGD